MAPVAELRVPLRLLVKQDRGPGQITVNAARLDGGEAFSGIRCPLCSWRPSPSNVWCCDRGDSPEPFFVGCGMVWNTFSTRGRCPGCSHQWRWTSCLQCQEASLHEAWYEERGVRPVWSG